VPDRGAANKNVVKGQFGQQHRMFPPQENSVDEDHPITDIPISVHAPK